LYDNDRLLSTSFLPCNIYLDIENSPNRGEQQRL